ncbi:CIC11C00000000409 [Sungouiella intermedia]|uniref:Topoisomerase 1-associated factor 1 n=1 Tax=Sungouiella intermedia TaxID=45354 RepID=A0A1L0BNW7_9ASCO|nr:CIC11C00000000409 [[Candida] intermedia]
MSESDDYRDDHELDEFIVSDEEPVLEQNDQQNVDEPPQIDRMDNLTSTLRVNETYTSKVLRAHISVLVSALGGPDHTSSEGLYKLGHDALACLKDLKRWIRSVDDRNGLADVALACAECGLVTNDLTVILCQWDRPPKGVKKTKTTEKIMLACLELLVLLTWPVDVNRKTLFKDYTAKTNARRAQITYKHHILSYKGGRTLKAVIRLGLEALQLPKDEREPRDVNILRLIMFFIRNVLFIEPLPPSKSPKAITNSSDLPNGTNPEDIGLNAVLTSFSKNNVLLFLTSVSHSLLNDLTDESFGLLAMECLSLLTKTVPVSTFFATKPMVPDASTTVPPASSAVGMQLLDLLSEEDKRKKRHNNTVSTRHGRFGTLLSIQTPDNASYYTVSGQDALASTYGTLDKMDRTKQWHRTSVFKYDSNDYVKLAMSYLNKGSADILSQFVNQFLISGCFNTVVRFVSHHLTNLTNDADLGRRGMLDVVDGHELASFFMTITWFFHFKRERLAFYQSIKQKPQEGDDSLDYGSIGAALSEVNFILLISYCRSSFDAKDYDSLHVALICLREMLLISNSIFMKERTQQEIELASEEDVNEDRELAEGIIRKLFSQKQFLDMMINVPKTAAKHSPEYLSVSVSVVHVLLKCFEALANEDVKLYIKTRRKMSKLNNRGGLNNDMDRQHWDLIDRGSDEEDDEEQIRYITQERKLDFKNTEVRFFHSDIVTTHLEYLSRFEDLSHEEIKRGITYFHRLFVVRKDYAALFRLDFMSMIHKLRNYLPRGSSIRRHVEEFIVYFMKKFKSAFERFPLAVELLFPRIENIEIKSFLSTGDLEATSSGSKRELSSKTPGLPKSSYFASDSPQPRAAAQLQFADEGKSVDEKIGILIYHIIKKKNALKFVKFLIGELERLVKLKSDGITQVLLRLNLANRRLLINDSHLRLLIEVLEFDAPFLQNDETILRLHVDAAQLIERKELIVKWLQMHEQGVGDIEPFLDQLRLEIFTKEQLDFGIASLANLRQGLGIDEGQVEQLGLTPGQIHKVIGLAKRKEYDEKIAAQYYADDDFVQPAMENSDEDDINFDDSLLQKKLRSRRRPIVEDALEFDDDEPKKITKSRRSRKDALLSIDSDDELESISKSAEMVHDSDDDSDSEQARAFFAREEQLRQLISTTGGIVNKELLKVFKESWQKIIGSNSDSQVKEAITKAALFVEDLDDDESPNIFSHDTTPASGVSDHEADMNKKRTTDAEVGTSRKRRFIVDDEEEE